MPVPPEPSKINKIENKVNKPSNKTTIIISASVGGGVLLLLTILLLVIYLRKKKRQVASSFSDSGDNSQNTTKYGRMGINKSFNDHSESDNDGSVNYDNEEQLFNRGSDKNAK